MIRAATFALALVACSSSSERAPAAKHELPQAAASACASALQRMSGGASYGALAECADLFPACAASWRQLSNHDVEVLATYRACRDAYCPKLAAPRPAVCDGRVIEDAGDGTELTALLTAMLVADHGVDPAQANGIASALVAPLAASRPIALPPVR